MEALTSLAVSLGPAFEPYAPAVFERTMQQLTAQHAALEAQVGLQMLQHRDSMNRGLHSSNSSSGHCSCYSLLRMPDRCTVCTNQGSMRSNGPAVPASAAAVS